MSGHVRDQWSQGVVCRCRHHADAGWEREAREPNHAHLDPACALGEHGLWGFILIPAGLPEARQAWRRLPVLLQQGSVPQLANPHGPER